MVSLELNTIACLTLSNRQQSKGGLNFGLRELFADMMEPIETSSWSKRCVTVQISILVRSYKEA
jgi:hypothetical protein